MTADQAAGILAVCIVHVRVANEIWDGLTPKNKGEHLGALEILEYLYCSRPMFDVVAVQEGCKTTNSICNVRACSNSNVVEAADELAVWCAHSPLNHLRCSQNRFVRAMEMEACNHWGISCMCFHLSKAINDTVNECSLRKGDGVAITVDGNTECELYRAEVRDFPLRLELVSEAGVFFRGPGNGKNIVDMDCKYDSAAGGTTDINTPFAWHIRESPALHSTVESLVPSATSLVHTINALHKAHDPSLLARFFKTRGLFHKGHLIITQNTMEEGGFDVEVLDVLT